jgi:hypothetical protein
VSIGASTISKALRNLTIGKTAAYDITGDFRQGEGSFEAKQLRQNSSDFASFLVDSCRG